MKTSMKHKLHTIIRRSQRTAFILLCVLAMLNTSIVIGHADEPDTTSVRTEQFFTTNDDSVPDTFDYVFEAVDAGSPMPAGSIGDRYDFSLTGNAADHVFNISYSVQGIYHYKLYQRIPSPQHEHYTYDESVYDITVYYTLDASSVTDRLKVTVQKVGGGKVVDPPFTNNYDDGTKPTQPETTGSGHHSSGGTPGTVSGTTSPTTKAETVVSTEGPGGTGSGSNNGGNSNPSGQLYDIDPEGNPFGTTWLNELSKTGENSVGFLLLYIAVAANILALIFLLFRRNNKKETK